MKVTLTPQEILAKFGLPVDTELTIENDTDEWISNIGYYRHYPPETLNDDTKIEVKYRNGEMDTGCASYYWDCWRETDGDKWDIVAYRILKD